MVGWCSWSGFFLLAWLLAGVVAGKSFDAAAVLSLDDAEDDVVQPYEHEQETSTKNTFELGLDGKWVVAPEAPFPHILAEEFQNLILNGGKSQLSQIRDYAKELRELGNFQRKDTFFMQLLSLLTVGNRGHALAVVLQEIPHLLVETKATRVAHLETEDLSPQALASTTALGKCIWEGNHVCVEALIWGGSAPASSTKDSEGTELDASKREKLGGIPSLWHELSLTVNQGSSWTYWSAFVSHALEAWSKRVWFSNKAPQHEWEDFDRVIKLIVDAACKLGSNRMLFPFHVKSAIAHRNLKAMNVLLDARSSLLQDPTWEKEPPLHQAVDFIPTLISVSKIMTDHLNLLYNRSDSHRVEEFGQLDTVFDTLEFIGLSQAKKSLQTYNASFDRTQLDAVIQPWNNRFVELLLSHGANPEARDLRENTVLHIAARSGNAFSARFLLKKFGAETLRLHDKNREGHTAMSLAQAMNHLKTQQVLLQHGAVLVPMTFYGSAKCPPGQETCVIGHTAPIEAFAKPEPKLPVDEQQTGWSTKVATTVDISYCDFDVQFNITATDLAEHYLHLRRPVIIRDPKILEWPAFRLWTKDHMKRRFGKAVFRVYEKIGVSAPISFPMELAEFIKYMEFESGIDLTPWWLVDTKWPKPYEKELSAALGRIDVAMDAMKILNPELEAKNFQFMLAPLFSGTSMHFHFTAVNVLLFGRKRWFLYPPHQAYYSTLHPHDWLQLEYPKLPQNQKPLECVQEAGDVIIVPDNWAHSTIASQETMGVAWLFPDSM